jgi:hypothetical protein
VSFQIQFLRVASVLYNIILYIVGHARLRKLTFNTHVSVYRIHFQHARILYCPSVKYSNTLPRVCKLYTRSTVASLDCAISYLQAFCRIQDSFLSAPKRPSYIYAIYTRPSRTDPCHYYMYDIYITALIYMIDSLFYIYILYSRPVHRPISFAAPERPSYIYNTIYTRPYIYNSPYIYDRQTFRYIYSLFKTSTYTYLLGTSHDSSFCTVSTVYWIYISLIRSQDHFSLLS